MRWPALIAALAFSVAGAAPGEPAGQPAAGDTPTALPLPPPMCRGDHAAPKRPTLLPGHGSGGFAIRTSVPMAQRFFDNGMQLAHAFAHGAGIAAMREAVRLDPACAACLWGLAWASGPTINYPIEEGDAVPLAEQVERARALAAGAPEKEKALIEALALRYPAGQGKYAGVQVAAANLAFAEAMDALARRWPDDDEIAVVTADAWMIASDRSGKHMGRAIELLEAVLKRSPDDTGAIHFYIHATEWIGEYARAETYADRLPVLAPAASHLIHMPSHTYFRIGRYRDAVSANARAVEVGRANARRLGLDAPDGEWGMDYHAHNVRFGVGAALISGDAKAALALSDPLVARVEAGGIDADSFAQLTAATAYFAQGRFADPAKVFALPAPPAKYGYAIGFWRFARGEAAARSGDAKAVRAEARAIRIPRPDPKDWGTHLARQALRIASHVLEGRAATLEGKSDRALAAFRRAATLQERDDFIFAFDPPAFWYPVRRDVAATLLAIGRRDEALAEADTALKLFPKDPETERIRGRVMVAARAARNRPAKQTQPGIAL